MGDIQAPEVSLSALAPLLFVFGAAAVGVLVEAFAPRSVRHPVQVAIALVGTIGAFVATLLLAGTQDITAGGATAVATAPDRASLRVLDLDRRELAVVTPLIAVIIVFGVYPQPLLELVEPAVAATMSDIGADPQGSGGTD